MMDHIFHMYAVHFLRSKLKNNLYPYKYLQSICIESHTVVNAFPSVVAYLLDSEVTGIPEDYYLFCIFLKYPDNHVLFVSEDWYTDIEKCRKEMKTYLAYFPIYGFSSRFRF